MALRSRIGMGPRAAAALRHAILALFFNWLSHGEGDSAATLAANGFRAPPSASRTPTAEVRRVGLLDSRQWFGCINPVDFDRWSGKRSRIHANRRDDHPGEPDAAREVAVAGGAEINCFQRSHPRAAGPRPPGVKQAVFP